MTLCSVCLFPLSGAAGPLCVVCEREGMDREIDAIIERRDAT